MGNTGEVICHFIEHFHAALSVTSRVNLDDRPVIRTAPGASDYAGVQLLWNMTELARAQSPGTTEVVLDCGDNPATVFGALRTGWTRVAYGGPEPLRRKVASVIAEQGRQLVLLNEGPVLDLYHSRNPISDCTVWLQTMHQQQAKS